MIPGLSRELANELPEEKCFSERDIKRMLAIYREYPDPAATVPQAAAQLPNSRQSRKTASQRCALEKVPRIVAEYALRGVYKPIGISEYEVTRALPANLRSALPTVEEIEEQLAEAEAGGRKPRAATRKAGKPATKQRSRKGKKP